MIGRRRWSNVCKQINWNSRDAINKQQNIISSGLSMNLQSQRVMQLNFLMSKIAKGMRGGRQEKLERISFRSTIEIQSTKIENINNYMVGRWIKHELKLGIATVSEQFYGAKISTIIKGSWSGTWIEFDNWKFFCHSAKLVCCLCSNLNNVASADFQFEFNIARECRIFMLSRRQLVDSKKL